MLKRWPDGSKSELRRQNDRRSSRWAAVAGVYLSDTNTAAIATL
jgi:hypothetical protein